MSRPLAMPHSEHAELAVLGACIRWGSQALADVRSVMGDEALWLEPSREIWLALRSLDEQGRPLDRISVETELRSRGKLAMIGGPSVLELVAGSAASKTSEVMGHATIVAEFAQARAVVQVSQALATTLLTNPLTGDALALELSAAVETITDISRNGAGGKMPWTAEQVGDESERERQLEISGETRAISTGFPWLDRLCKRKGPRPGWLVVLGGRPKMGKTSAALQMALAAMFDPIEGWPRRWKLKAEPAPVLIACDEMRATELYDRLLANIAGLDASAMGAPSKEWEERNRNAIDAARKLLDGSPLHFVPDVDSDDLTKICAYIRRWRRSHRIQGRDRDGNPTREPALVVFDFLQSFAAMPGTEKNSEREQIGAKVKFVKKESLATGVVSLMLSQLNRDLEKRDRDDRRPRASDNEGSGKIEQFGDVIIGCYRDVVYDENEQTYKDQVTNLRRRVAVAAKDTGAKAGRAFADLDEMLAIAGDPAKAVRLDVLRTHGYLGDTEFDQLLTATNRLSAAELIIQRNRHGDTGTVYLDFRGKYYRFTPRHRTNTA